MIIAWLRALTGSERDTSANRQLALFLTFVAGALNANGFLAVAHYTTHITGLVSTLAGNVISGQDKLIISGLCALIAFIAGATCSTIIMHHASRKKLQSVYAQPLLLEAMLLLLFGLFGDSLRQPRVLYFPEIIIVMCFTMGLQNATVTKMTKAEIRTTHLTGLITDLGSELGRLIYWNSKHGAHHNLPAIRADRKKLRLFISLFAVFFAGSITGSAGFIHAGGCTAILPLGLLLAVLAVIPVIDDLYKCIRKKRQTR